MKLNTKTAGTFAADSIVAIGSKGTALVLGNLPEGVKADGTPLVMPWASFKAAGVTGLDLCMQHAKGRPFGAPLSSYDAGCYVSRKGMPFALLPVKLALSKGLLQTVEVRITREGEPARNVTALVRKGWTPAEKLPFYLATPGVPAGRVERSLINETGGRESRNAVLTYRVSLPSQPAPAAPKAQKPVPTKATPPKSTPAKPAKK